MTRVDEFGTTAEPIQPDAALALYGDRGFENTTIADIAGRAGRTERTFFRYFADEPRFCSRAPAQCRSSS